MEYSIVLIVILLLPIVGSFIGYMFGTRSERRRDIFNIKITGINLLLVTILYKPVSIQPIDISINYIMGTGLHFRLDMFRFIFLWITSLIWFLVTIYSTHYLIRYKNRNRYYFFFMMTLGSTIGLFISENLLNLFTFFEIMSLTSYALIIHDEDDYSHDAGDTYIVTAVAGGLTLLMGLFLLYNYTQTLDISKLYVAVKGLGRIKYVISTLIIIGFGIKAGMVPLHIWLPKAHPAAPAPASAVLSGILLKTGIFGIILTVDIMLREDYYVSIIILSIGLINMLMGGFLAMFQRNIKRILAYSSMSQMGYILVGVGLAGILKEYSSLAIIGTLFHIVNHAIFKVLLFMGAGVIYMALHELSINEIGGYGKNKTVLKIIFLIGVLAITGAPGFNGYASKTLLHEALSVAHSVYHSSLFTAAEIIFTLSSSFTVAYILKIFAAVFIDDSDHDYSQVQGRISKITILPLVILCGLVMYIGIKPQVVFDILGGTLKTFGDIDIVKVQFFSMEAIKSSAVSLLLGCSIYLLFVRGVLRKGAGTSWYYVNPTLKWFNLENNLYKPVGLAAFHVGSVMLRFIDGFLVGTASSLGKTLEDLGKIEVDYAKRVVNIFKKESVFAVDFIKGIRSKGKRADQEKEEKKESVEQYENTLYSLKELVCNLTYKMNSVTYSVFIFAVVLVTCLLFLLLTMHKSI